MGGVGGPSAGARILGSLDGTRRSTLSRVPPRVSQTFGEGILKKDRASKDFRRLYLTDRVSF